jgi:hypothetical protein
MVAHKKKNTHNNIHRTCVCVCLSTIYRTLCPFLFSLFSFQFELRGEEGLLFSFEMKYRKSSSSCPYNFNTRRLI